MSINKKGKNGITLIALVITIIVLLILAGISISMLSGDNSILKQAGKARDMTEQSKLEEEVDIAYLEYISDTDKTHDLEYYLNKIGKVTVTSTSDDSWYVSGENAGVTIYENGEKDQGKTEVWNETNEECPEFKDFNWYIYKPSQLKFLADFVNNDNTLTTEQETIISNTEYSTSDIKMDETVTVYLMNNIDLGARPGEGTTEVQKWETEANESRKWTPIGISSELNFSGVFDGKDHTIKGVYVNSTKSETGHGLFGNSNTIRNLTIQNSYIKGGKYTGGIVGALVSGEIRNCHNKNTIIKNIGEVNTFGGIVGIAEKGDTEMLITNCTNRGKIIPDERLNVTGGIVGHKGGKCEVNNCENYGEIYGNCILYTGGIAGVDLAGEGAFSISNCSNFGNISALGGCTGGIAGAINPHATLKNCMNTGNISSLTNAAGGILGMMAHSGGYSYSIVEKCYNSGNITGIYSVGGIIGQMGGANGYGTLRQCYSKGTVVETDTSMARVGAVVGYQTNQTGANTLNKLYYYTNEDGLTAAGGVADNETNEIRKVSEDLSYEQFKTWIEEQ